MDPKPLASRLEGKKVGKWSVLKRREKQPDSSGFFSTGYSVVDADGNEGFLKAFNYLYAFSGGAGSSVDVMKAMVDNFTYERNLLEFCSNHKMRRVVTAIDSGEYSEQGEVFSVPYLVFEVATSDLKSHPRLTNPGLKWKLTAFHGALVGLGQLHRKRIAHQDIKPSNILVFGLDVSKISDLGCATQQGNSSRFEVEGPAGDLRYAPVELLYRHCSLDWDTRRFGADFFMMGGLLTYLVTGINFLGLIYSHLHVDQRHDHFGGSFSQALPFLQNAYDLSLEQVKQAIPAEIGGDLIIVIGQLNHPDPEKRGNPQRFPGDLPRFSLERYISVIDRISKKIA
jgi:serine/threonine protein kinase